MRVAFVANTYLDPGKRSSWSGLPYFMRRSLEHAGLEVETILLPEPNPASGMLRYAYWRFLRGRRFLRNRETSLQRHYSREVERSLAATRADVVFCPSSQPVAYLSSKIPMVFWTDACFAGMVDFYASFTNLAPCSLADGHAAETSALSNCSRAIYSSQWAASKAKTHYGISESKVDIVAFGGNVADRPSLAQVREFVSARAELPLRLLLVGVDWARKGADVAVEAVTALNERGVPAQLTIIGCAPPGGANLPRYVETIPFVDKSTAEGALRFNEICRRSHFMLMPSRADCTPVAIVEGFYFGLPCLASHVGGIPSQVINEINGRLFSLESRGAAYADYILSLMKDRSRYHTLALRTALYADQHLSWEVSGRRVAALLREVISGGDPRRESAAAVAGTVR